MLMTPTRPSTEPPVAQASSGAFDQVWVTITMILCWASRPGLRRELHRVDVEGVQVLQLAEHVVRVEAVLRRRGTRVGAGPVAPEQDEVGRLLGALLHPRHLAGLCPAARDVDGLRLGVGRGREIGQRQRRRPGRAARWRRRRAAATGGGETCDSSTVGSGRHPVRLPGAPGEFKAINILASDQCVRGMAAANAVTVFQFRAVATTLAGVPRSCASASPSASRWGTRRTSPGRPRRTPRARSRPGRSRPAVLVRAARPGSARTGTSPARAPAAGCPRSPARNSAAVRTRTLTSSPSSAAMRLLDLVGEVGRLPAGRRW